MKNNSMLRLAVLCSMAGTCLTGNTQAAKQAFALKNSKITDEGTVYYPDFYLNQSNNGPHPRFPKRLKTFKANTRKQMA